MIIPHHQYAPNADFDIIQPIWVANVIQVSAFSVPAGSSASVGPRLSTTLMFRVSQTGPADQLH